MFSSKSGEMNYQSSAPGCRRFDVLAGCSKDKHPAVQRIQSKYSLDNKRVKPSGRQNDSCRRTEEEEEGEEEEERPQSFLR